MILLLAPSFMPINEAKGFYPSNLTTKQQREAMQAVYGLGGESMSPSSMNELTYEERVKLRRLLDAQDQKEAGGLKEFDLNSPKVPPYVYREYPFVMYHHETKTSRPARNHEEREQMVAQGWTAEPFNADAPQIPLTAAEQAEAQEIDSRLKKRKT